VRTTLAIPSDLLEATDRAVREGKARSRNEFVTTALRRELAARRRAEIDAEIAEMANDPEYLQEVEQIMAEFAESDAEVAGCSKSKRGRTRTTKRSWLRSLRLRWHPLTRGPRSRRAGAADRDGSAGLGLSSRHERVTANA